MQLVIVEAVPSLTEVVKESCSSSESDSDEDDVDGVASKTKKKTLSPEHTREVDKKEKVCFPPSHSTYSRHEFLNIII